MTVNSIAAYHHPTPLDTRFEAMSLPAMFERTMRANPQAPFLHFLGRTYSYQQIFAYAQRFAVGLQAIGIAKGDRVGLFLPNVPIYAAAYYGAMMAGAVVVNFSPLYSVEELSWQVGDSGTRVLVTVDVPELTKTATKVLASSALETLVVGRLADMLPWYKGLALKLLKRAQIADVVYGPSIRSWADMTPARALTPVEVTPADLALLQYTGGTTGRPKGAMLGHDQLSVNAQQVAALNPFGNPTAEVFMGALPFFHVFANTALLNHAMVTGASIAMVPRFETKQVLETIQKYRCTGFPGVPTMFQAMLDHPDLAKTDLSSLKVCISGGAPMPGPVHQRFEDITGVRICEGYGLTESSGVVSANPYDGTRKRGTIGQLVPGTEVILLDKEHPERLAPDGEPGELAVHGPQVMRGYWQQPQETQRVLKDGWLYTGDVAVMDADGYFRIVDRKKDLVLVSGFNVYPNEVEDALAQMDAVLEAAVVGVPDPVTGEAVRAYIVRNPEVPGELTREAVIAHCKTCLTDYKIPKSIVFRDELPKTPVGKILRKDLKVEVQAEFSKR